jgi:hypothetical protein
MRCGLLRGQAGRLRVWLIGRRLFWIEYMLHCFVIFAVVVPDLVRCPFKDGQVLGLLNAAMVVAVVMQRKPQAPQLTFADPPRDARLHLAEEVVPGVRAVLLGRQPVVDNPCKMPQTVVFALPQTARQTTLGLGSQQGRSRTLSIDPTCLHGQAGGHRNAYEGSLRMHETHNCVPRVTVHAAKSP